MKDIRAAAVICQAPLGDIDGNLARMRRWVHSAADRGAELVCFPELNLTGYAVSPEIRSAAIEIPGPVTDQMLAWAGHHRMTILGGAAERAPDGRLHAAHLAAFPDGRLRIYRKLHIAPPEAPYFSPGDDLTMLRVEGSTVGVQLCYDAHFPELSTLMALRGADLILVPHASPHGTAEGKRRSWERHLTARAFDNGLYLIAVNLTGDNGAGLTFPGTALAIDPAGRVLAALTPPAGVEEMLVVDLSAGCLDAVRGHRMRYFLPRRRPDLYDRLTRDLKTEAGEADPLT